MVADSNCGPVVVAEAKKRKPLVGRNVVEDFSEKVSLFSEQNPDKTVLTAFLSLGGFTPDVMAFCQARGIGTLEGAMNAL